MKSLFQKIASVGLAGAVFFVVSSIFTVSVLYSDQLNGKLAKLTALMQQNDPPDCVSPMCTAPVSLHRNNEDQIPAVDVKRRINCFPEEQGTDDVQWTVTEYECDRRGCTYDEDTGGNNYAPPCYMHPAKVGYRVAQVMRDHSDPEWFLALKLETLSPTTIFDPPISPLIFRVKVWNNRRLQIKIEDPNNARYEVPFPWQIQKDATSNETTADFELTYQADPFSFQVRRKSTGVLLVDTSMGGFVFSDRYIQLTSVIPSENFYGLGEHEHGSLRHNLHYKTWPIFSYDEASLGEGKNLYGAHPFHFVLENDGNSHGVFIVNSNAMEYVMIPAPGFIFRTIGGIIDLHLMTGPSPTEVIQQHLSSVGLPVMPPYWALGFHLARYGYKNLSHVQEAVNRTRQYGIPLDAIHADIDYMAQKKMFTIDQKNFGGLSEYFDNERRKNGLRSVIILDPAITNNCTDYEPWKVLDGNKTFITWENGSTLFGYVWVEGQVAFPDFFLERTKDVWLDLVVRFSKQLSYDGLWLDMNEPANFGTNDLSPWNYPIDKPPWSLKCPDTGYEKPPYRTYATSLYDHGLNHGFRTVGRKAQLSDKTICMEARQNDGKYRHYDVHNLYGWSQTPITLRAIQTAYPGRRGFLLARATYPGSGAHASHWSGDNLSTWSHMERSIIFILENNFFGMPHSGADICGYVRPTTPELCLRWTQLGAFYPFSRNHNDDLAPDQDPGVFGPEFGAMTRRYLLARYEVLPYFYTLHYYANKEGLTVARPLFFEFPRDNATWAIDRQFMLGPSLLVSPLLDKGKSSFFGYVPQGLWFDRMNGEHIDHCTGGGRRHFFNINGTSLLQRGGSVIATQFPGNAKIIATDFTKFNPFSLSIVMGCDLRARGTLFWDDGESLDTVGKGEYYLVSYSAFVDKETDNLIITSVKEHDSRKKEVGNGLTYAQIHIGGVGKSVKNARVDCNGAIDCPAKCPSIKCSDVNRTLKNLTCWFEPEMSFTNDFAVVLAF